jgi:SagB-type dehydrogenase family enzyme
MKSRAGDTARLYHELSSYWYEPGVLQLPPKDHQLVVRDFVTNDRPTFPAHTKSYAGGLPAVDLPDRWPAPDMPAIDALGGAIGAEQVFDLEQLGRLLHLSAGVVRVATRRDGRFFRFRPAGSAGGLFPLELYVAARGVAGLEDGVWWYDPVAHALRLVGPAPGGQSTALVVNGIPWRTGWRYAERGYRHLCWDAGTMLPHPMLLAASVGIEARLWTTFPDAEVARLLGADMAQELPLAVIALGPGVPAITPGGDAIRGTIDAAPLEFPLVTLAHRAGNTSELGEPWPTVPVLADLGGSASLDEVILGRGSARELDGSASLTRERLEATLTLGLRGARVPHWLAVSAVDGIQPGVYRWPDLDAPVRTGDLRDELWRACWEQDLCRTASAVVISAIDLDSIDDRGYREAQLAAGVASGRIQLAATALGVAVSAMSFMDPLIPELLGAEVGGLLLTCLGVAPRTTKRAGTPRHPTDVSEPGLGGS